MKKLKRFFLIYITFLILIIISIVFFQTNKSFELRLKEGESYPFNKIYKKFDLTRTSIKYITLESFKIDVNSDVGNQIAEYESQVLIHDNVISESYSIKLNNPLKLYGIEIYQKSWLLSVNNLIFNFRNKQYDVSKTSRDTLKTEEGNIFHFYPGEVLNNKNILYHWQLISKEGAVIKKGAFHSKSSLELKYLKDEFGFFIIKKDFSIISIFDICYKPLYKYVFYSTLLFFIAILITFWGDKIGISYFKKENRK